MNREVASAVSQSLNHPKIINAINDYLDYRIKLLHEQMETTTDDRLMHQLQGAIRELRLMYKLRDNALNMLENERRANG